MNGISGTRRRRSKEQVKRLVAEFEASGLERREFRGRHGLALSILQRHLSLFQEALGIREGADGARKYVLDLSYPAEAELENWDEEAVGIRPDNLRSGSSQVL